MSLTANLPKGGYSEKLSQVNALIGIRFIMAASPDFKNAGNSSITLPFLLSILDIISENLHAR